MIHMFKDNICDNEILLVIIRIFNVCFEILKVVLPILVIILITLTIYNYIINNNEENLKKIKTRFINSIIGTLIVFILPALINNIMEYLNPETSKIKACWLESETEVYFIKKVDYPTENIIIQQSKLINEETLTELHNSTNNDPNSQELVSIAETLWKKIYNGKFKYNAENTEKIPLNKNLVDCSSFVSWILYEYGYKDFSGNQHRTKNFMETNWNKKYGWEEIYIKAGENPTNKLKPGDLFVRTNVSKNGKIGYGHITFIVGVKDGKVYSYDCGSEHLWKKSGGKPVLANWFMKDSRPGKIIRINQ